MTIEQFVEHMRQEIREEGFISAMQLVARIFARAEEHGLKIDCMDVLTKLSGGDIHTVEYTNSAVADYRVKDLYYYNPHQS